MDLNVSAFRIVKSVTTEKETDKRSLAAKAGGRIGGPARANKLTPERRREIAVVANKARWNREEVKNHGGCDSVTSPKS